jgi:hypothetical protein
MSILYSKPIIEKLVIIHIGKCGGSTVTCELRKHNIPFETVHVSRAKYDPSKRYVIVTRNPTAQFVSAFNWRLHILTHEKANVFKNEMEKKLLLHYGNVNDLAMDLYHKSGTLNQTLHNTIVNTNSHLYKRNHFYLCEFLRDCPKQHIRGVICTETIGDDMKRIFNVQITSHANNNTSIGYRTDLSNVARANLNKYLKDDYACLEYLIRIGCILKGSGRIRRLLQ